MTEAQALSIAEKVASGRCVVTIHKGNTAKDRAIRLSGLDQWDARPIGKDIASALVGEYREDPGFCVVWYDPTIKADRLDALRKEIDDSIAEDIAMQYE